MKDRNKIKNFFLFDKSLQQYNNNFFPTALFHSSKIIQFLRTLLLVVVVPFCRMPTFNWKKGYFIKMKNKTIRKEKEQIPVAKEIFNLCVRKE